MSHSSHDMSDMSDMDDMSMSSSSMDSSSSMTMSMTFHNSITDPLFSTQWTPKTGGQYAGTCIFLLVLSIIYRGLLVLRYRVDKHTLRRAGLADAALVAADKNYDLPVLNELDDLGEEEELFNYAEDAEDEEKKQIEIAARSAAVQPAVHSPRRRARPFRLSVDAPHAVLQMVNTGVAYLLMIAVMGGNVGYFIAVVGGVLLGELIFARYAL